MLKQHLLKLALGLAIIAALIAGVSAESSAAAKVAPSHHLLACGATPLPPCF